jgi:hypothetical protein
MNKKLKLLYHEIWVKIRALKEPSPSPITSIEFPMYQLLQHDQIYKLAAHSTVVGVYG